MSPVPLHVVETERVQGPLTLSETRTWPATLYWLNHPISRSPARTGSVRVRVCDVERKTGGLDSPHATMSDAVFGVKKKAAGLAEGQLAVLDAWCGNSERFKGCLVLAVFTRPLITCVL